MSTMSDVARMAGVSVPTVSRMLNGTLRLPDATRIAIETAIAELNYRPNPHARSLSRGQTDRVSMVVPDIKVPFFATLVAAVENRAFERQKELALSVTLNRPGRELRYLDSVAARHVDGLIFVTNHSSNSAELAARINAARRVVILDEDVLGAEAPRLMCDNTGGGYMAGQYLAAHGHCKVGAIGVGDTMLSGQRRFEGFSRALQEAFGDGAQIHRISGEYTVEDGRMMCAALLDTVPDVTAIFAMSDEMVMGCLEVFAARGLRVPDDISLIGFDDILPLHLLSPPITAIRQPVEEMGQRALDTLLDMDWEDPEARKNVTILPVSLVERSSVAFVRPSLRNGPTGETIDEIGKTQSP